MAAGYACYHGHADLVLACAACGGAILVGDSIPFVLGRVFGAKLLRVRLVRSWISTKRLALFDSWFQKHGRLTIFVARFLAGIRVPAFFAAGTMRTSVARFVVMDGLGILIGVPAFIALGYFGGEHIDVVLDWVRRLEQGILILLGVGVVTGLGIWFWYHRRRSRKILGEEVSETFVEGPTSAEAQASVQTPSADKAAPAPPSPSPDRDKNDAVSEDAPTSLEPPPGQR